MNEPNENKTGESSFRSKDLSTELEHQAEVTKLSSDLLRDFYQTFRLSQGVTNIQESLFELLAREHLQSQHTGMLVDALEQAEERVVGLMPPVRHIETDQDTRNDPKTGFDAMWNQYKDLLQNPKVESERPVENILDIIIEKEISYQKTVRPNRTENDDPNESIVREYILDDKLAGSDELKRVILHLREVLLLPGEDEGEVQMATRLVVLAARWEENHPGQNFLIQNS